MTAADSGNWTCRAKKHVVEGRLVSETVELTVAMPYALSVAPKNPLWVVKSRNDSDDEVVCRADGGGAIDPVMTWYVAGQKAESQSTRQWEEEVRQHYRVFRP